MIEIHKYLLVFILIKLYLISAQYINPTPRQAHASTLIGSKLYFIGGYDDKHLPRADFFYLDLSILFTTNDKSTLPFVSVDNNGLTSNAECKVATINNIMYLFGGYLVDTSADDNNIIKKRTNLVYQYDIKSGQWTKPYINGTSPVRRSLNGLIVEPSTKAIYYFGGYNGSTPFNDMWILNTNNQLSWQQIFADILVFPSFGYTATLLTDGNVLCIGGWTNTLNMYTPMTTILRYNIKANTWESVQTQGYQPGIRDGHSAVLVPDGRIIVYGGRTIAARGSFPPTEDLVVLNTTKFPYVWELPKKVENKPVVRAYHTACLYENYMIVAFGNLTDKTLTSEILLLDVTDKLNYKWISNSKNFSTTSTFPTSTFSSTSNKNNVGIIIGSTIGSIFGISLVGAIIFFGRKFYKKKRGIIRIPGGNRV